MGDSRGFIVGYQATWIADIGLKTGLFQAMPTPLTASATPTSPPGWTAARGNRNVLARVHRALKPGGTLQVAEVPYPDSPEAYRTEPASRMLTGVQLHEALIGGGAITLAELPELLHGANFTDASPTSPCPRLVMLADKPPDYG